MNLRDRNRIEEIAEEIEAFDQHCQDGDYTSTGLAWDLLKWIQTTCRIILRDAPSQGAAALTLFSLEKLLSELPGDDSRVPGIKRCIKYYRDCLGIT